MNRTKKCCVYRECTSDSVTNPDLTLFQFPKNEERAAKWCELGAVDPVDTRPRFMCELHFPQIYMCFSARRKMLLNTAIPHAFGTQVENKHDPEQVQSTSYETEEIPIEEHLDEGMLDEGEDITTEIIYMDQTEFEHEQDEISKKRSRPVETTSPSKSIKLENISSASRSMVVSSSSTKPLTVSKKPITTFTAPQGTILRKVKLKKRPAVARAVMVQANHSASITQKVAATEIKPLSSVSDAKEQAKRASPIKATPAVASSSNSTVVGTRLEEEQKKPQVNKSPEKKDDTIYEFIFKGEEYIQLPKAKYDSERKQLEMQLEQSVKVQERLRKKIDYYQRSLKDLTEFLQNVCEENEVDDDDDD